MLPDYLADGKRNIANTRQQYGQLNATEKNEQQIKWTFIKQWSQRRRLQYNFKHRKKNSDISASTKCEEKECELGITEQKARKHWNISYSDEKCDIQVICASLTAHLPFTVQKTKHTKLCTRSISTWFVCPNHTRICSIVKLQTVFSSTTNNLFNMSQIHNYTILENQHPTFCICQTNQRGDSKRNGDYHALYFINCNELCCFL